MTQLKAIYLEQVYNFTVGDDVDMTFILRDENGSLISSFTDYYIRCEVTNNSDETLLKNTKAGGGDSQISTSGAEITIHIPNTDTTNYSEGEYRVELQLTISSKIYTVFSEDIYFKAEKLDW